MTDSVFTASPLSSFLEMDDLTDCHLLLHPACGDLFNVYPMHTCSDSSFVPTSSISGTVVAKAVQLHMLKGYRCSWHLLGTKLYNPGLLMIQHAHEHQPPSHRQSS